MIYTKEDFIEKSNLTHNYRYDYSQVNFINVNTKVDIICKIHGTFSQRPNAHYFGQGCRKCNQPKPNLLTTEEFIRRSNIKHNNKFDYSLVEYVNNSTKVNIICPIHGSFIQDPCSHMGGCGCRKCYYENIPKKNKSYYIDKANIKHNFKYDYSLVPDFINIRDKVHIRCKNNHIFYQVMSDHLDGNGCKFCSQPCYNTESFIKLSNEKHGNKYDYSKSIYVHQKTKLIIICPKHGEFLQKPSNHYHLGRGCPRCHESKGEIEIRKWLQNNNILYKKEHTFENCKHIGRLRFDFYLPEYNMCIEFDGAQHFVIINQFGGIEEFDRVRLRDDAKNRWCCENKIRLLRISYKELNKVEDILDDYFIN